jgi:hypothetical protein
MNAFNVPFFWININIILNNVLDFPNQRFGFLFVNRSSEHFQIDTPGLMLLAIKQTSAI